MDGPAILALALDAAIRIDTAENQQQCVIRFLAVIAVYPPLFATCVAAGFMISVAIIMLQWVIVRDAVSLHCSCGRDVLVM